MRYLLLAFFLPLSFFGQKQIGSRIIAESEGVRLGLKTELSDDGSILATISSNYARVYKNIDGAWEQLGQDIESFDSSIPSISSISISTDGSILAVGSVDSVNGYKDGQVRIFKIINNVWEQVGKSIVGNVTDNTFDALGINVDLSSDGKIIAFSGIVGTQIFKNNNDSWEKVGITIESGSYLSLSSDGSIIAVNRADSNVRGGNIGRVAIYKNKGDVWEQIGEDIVGEEIDDNFGYSISLSSDGSIIAIGAPLNNGTSWDEGHVRVFKNNNGLWEQIGEDIDGKSRGDRSAQSISLSSDGNKLAIGTPFSDENGKTSGRVRVYKNDGNVWKQLGEQIEGYYEKNFFGSAVSLSSIGNYIAIGGPDFAFGSVKVYSLQETLSTKENNTTEKFIIYPNPAKNLITLENQNSNLKKISIFNNLGQLVLQSKEKEINISKLKTGIYFVKVETNKGKSIKKLFKQ